MAGAFACVCEFNPFSFPCSFLSLNSSNEHNFLICACRCFGDDDCVRAVCLFGSCAIWADAAVVLTMGNRKCSVVHEDAKNDSSSSISERPKLELPIEEKGERGSLALMVFEKNGKWMVGKCSSKQVMVFALLGSVLYDNFSPPHFPRSKNP